MSSDLKNDEDPLTVSANSITVKGKEVYEKRAVISSCLADPEKMKYVVSYLSKARRYMRSVLLFPAV
jgi:hypothetical protein